MHFLFLTVLSSYEEFNDSSPPTTPDPACEDLILSNIGSDEESNHCSPSTSPDPTSEDEDLGDIVLYSSEWTGC